MYAGEKDGAPILEAPAHPPTMGELMSHTAGFTYGLFGNTPVDKIYRKNNPLEAPSLQAMIDRLSTLPLLYQPGTRWVYSVSVDIQGYLVEKLSGKTFPEFLRTRLFEPLGMIDTGVLRAGGEAARAWPRSTPTTRRRRGLAPAPGESIGTSCRTAVRRRRPLLVRRPTTSASRRCCSTAAS